jgi:hypothetical protein
VCVIGLLLLLLPNLAIAATSVPERIPLTLSLLQERLNTPFLSDGVETIDLRHLTIDLSNNNAEFREQFYQQLQTRLNRAKQPLGLDLSESSIQGEFIMQRLGLPTSLATAALPPLLTPTEQAALERDAQFSAELGEQIASVMVFRGPLKLQGSRFTDQVDFSKTFFLQRVEASGVTFTQEVKGSETRFARSTDFSRATWNRDLDLSHSTFFGTAKFSQCQFQGSVNFSNSIFWESANWSQSQFYQVGNFTRIQWLKEVDFSQVNWRDRVLFSSSHFFKSLSFVNSTFEKAVAFRATRFSRLVDLQDVKLLEQFDFSNALFFPRAYLNISGLAFDSDQARIVGDTGVIGRVMFLSKLEENETVVRNLIRNFRRLEQIPDANQIEYKAKQLKLKNLSRQLTNTPVIGMIQLAWLEALLSWLSLSLLLLLSNYGTNFGLVFGVGILSIAYFGFIFWATDRWRRRIPQPILPNRYDTICMVSSFSTLTLLGVTNIFQSSEQPWITLMCLGFILLPIPLLLLGRLYDQGRYHDLMESSYFLMDDSMRQLRLLIVRLPVVPEFPFFRDRYIPLPWERRWNWLNYYDFSCNNFIKLGFNDIRLRDRSLPALISTLVWYQWSLGTLYIVLLLWTLSRTIPGLNLLIYLK